MIWGKTSIQKIDLKEAKKSKLGDEKVVFVWFPRQLNSGRWVWWEYVRCIAKMGGYHPHVYWIYLEAVKKG